MASWMKAVLISTGFLATAMHLKVIVPVAVDFSQAPILLSSFLTWLKPPYLYVITNVIIVVIFVSSKFFRSSTVSSSKDYEVSYSGDNKFQTDHHHQQNVHRAPLRRRTETKGDADFGFVAKVAALIVVKEPEVVYEEKKRVVEAAATVEEEHMCLVVVTKPEISQPEVEKPLVTARIGQRKPVVKTTPAERNSVRALRVAKPKRNETLENTWKMIMEGKSSALPLTSYYKRPDTFGLGEEATKQSGGLLKKSETFSDRTNNCNNHSMPAMLPPPPPPVKLVKKVKVSRSRDELNRRVEAFIKKCNDERFASMRLDDEVDRRGLSY